MNRDYRILGAVESGQQEELVVVIDCSREISALDALYSWKTKLLCVDGALFMMIGLSVVYNIGVWYYWLLLASLVLNLIFFVSVVINHYEKSMRRKKGRLE